MAKELISHWDKVYKTSPLERLGWFESKPTASLRLIECCNLDRQSPILDAGSGTSTLIPTLLDMGYTELTALDISDLALQKAWIELGEERAKKVHWMVNDILQPSDTFDLEGIALWHDRAFFHFLTRAEEQHKYRETMLRSLHPSGFVILSAYTHGSPPKCSGLPVNLQDRESLVNFMGTEFNLMECFESTFRMPSGETRQYVHTLFQRKDFFTLSMNSKFSTP
jgi:hypothetical protein